MQLSFRYGLFGGVAIALLAGLFLAQLWNPDRQVALHTDHLLRAIERHDWNRVQAFVASDYHDQWEHDRAALIDRAREVLHFVRSPEFRVSQVRTQAADGKGTWRGRIELSAGDGEIAGEIKARLNSSPSLFTLEWRNGSGKPWDWQLVSAGNPELEIPAEFR